MTNQPSSTAAAHAPTVWCVETTLPSHAAAEQLARSALGARLAACAHISPAHFSLYHWRDRLETAHEHKLILKTSDATREALVSRLEQEHPYDTPEIAWFPMRTTARYSAWVDKETTQQVEA